MSLNRKVLFAIALLTSIVGISAVFLMMARPPAVSTLVVSPQTTERVLAVVGRVRPIERVDVKAIYPGQVVRLLQDEGDRVAAGQPLAVIKAVAEQAQTDAEFARADAARARAVEARQKFARTSTLLERGFAARAALDQARAELRTAEAEVAAAGATARASAERTREFVVRAPAASLILARPVDPGQVVDTTTILFELAAGRGGEIEAEVDEAYGDAIRPGMRARISPTGERWQATGTVTEVSPKVDASTGGRLVRLSYDAATGLIPGRSVDVTIIVQAAAPLILVPRQAVVEATVAPKVYVVDRDDRVAVRRVRIVDWPSTAAIVQSGLAGGERVVLAPSKVRPGDRVRREPAR